MDDRRGAKFGWIGGWLGGFIWVVILSVVFLVQGRLNDCLIGLGIFCAAVIFIFVTAPWKHPNTPYWKLMIPVYVALAGAVVWLFRTYSGQGSLTFGPWSIFMVLPILIPFVTAGRRCWNDFNA